MHPTPCRRFLATATAGLLLGACSVVPELARNVTSDAHVPAPAGQAGVVPVALSPAPRPSLSPGDTFIYGRSTVVRLLRVGNGQQEWQRSNPPTTLSSGGDFFAPPLRTTSSGLHTESTLEGRPADLWPLAAGRSVRFVERRQMTWSALRLTRSARYDWTCQVVDARMSYVPAGDFETFHVRCEGRSDSLLFPSERLSWDYAPQMGQPVRRTWWTGGRERVATLSAALPGELATDTRIASVLHRLAAQP